jgi:peptide deformylase
MKKSKYTRDDIITLPHPHLRQRSARIRAITDETRQLIDDMLAATLDWEESRPHEVAVALAAVQIDRLERVVIVREDFEHKENQRFVVLINPEIVKKEGEITMMQEGCLSVKDVYCNIPRHSKIRIKAIDLSGHEVRFRSSDSFMSHLLQHEIDHTNGICIVDHVAQQKDAFSILTDSGELVPYPYEKVVESGILPDE